MSSAPGSPHRAVLSCDKLSVQTDEHKESVPVDEQALCGVHMLQRPEPLSLCTNHGCCCCCLAIETARDQTAEGLTDQGHTMDR